jgi:hypothetical protein
MDRPEEGALCPGPGPGLVNGPFLCTVRETIYQRYELLR